MAITLRSPPKPSEFALQTLRTKPVESHTLFRASTHTTNEPYFGRSGSNRFDDPNKVFGTSYFGFDVATAIAETVLHDLMPENSRFEVAQADFEYRQIIRLPRGRGLVLADLTGAALKTLVGDSSLTTVTPYDIPQAWAAAIHDHPDNVDGLYYVSRQLDDRKAVVIFERAKPKLGAATYAMLGTWPALMRIRKTLSIDYVAP